MGRPEQAESQDQAEVVFHDDTNLACFWRFGETKFKVERRIDLGFGCRGYFGSGASVLVDLHDLAYFTSDYPYARGE
jgi:hypothetical protein